MSRKNISSGAPWEATVGYSRAVKVGSLVFVAGTTATNSDGQMVGIGNAYEQTFFVLKKIEKALQEAGATFNNVVRTRIFVKNMDDWEAIGRAHGEVFKDIRPAATMVEVSRFIHDDILVEIEADAVIF
ncbi:MAG TPA: RidA family protein [Patescibacteria group bacterium]|nr:RidA family protein [Patescibacteria group bacterium]